MAASDHLGQQWYAGGPPGVGSHLDPGHKMSSGRIHFTTSADVAKYYGPEMHRNGKVYRVEPTGPYESDPHERDSFRTSHPVRVIGEA